VTPRTKRMKRRGKKRLQKHEPQEKKTSGRKGGTSTKRKNKGVVIQVHTCRLQTKKPQKTISEKGGDHTCRLKKKKKRRGEKQ